ncbi:MAG TPA: SRPBCC domain-containing protein [Streptosporangiaceae bacterium]|nr:SRPBCC domain-containing protein [Streptosporangiaceae bacterium]
MSEDGSFETTVDLNAPVQEVFRHLTDPVAMIRWMGQHAALEPAPGGAFEVDINGVPVRGRYLEVDPPPAGGGQLGRGREHGHATRRHPGRVHPQPDRGRHPAAPGPPEPPAGRDGDAQRRLGVLSQSAQPGRGAFLGFLTLGGSVLT